MTTRRLLLAGLGSTLAAPGLADPTPQALVERAIARAGGRAALERAKVLAWTGRATLVIAGRTLEIEVDTAVEPFRWARTNSWLVSDGPAKARTMLIEGDAGSTIIDGQKTPLPAPAVRHERQQFALYGLMRLLPLLEARLTPLPARDGLQGLRVEHPQAPEAEMWFEPDGRLAVIRDRVVDPAGGPRPIDQTVTLSGEIDGKGVRWPRRLQIAQDNQSYFDLRLASFEPRSAP